MVHSGVEPGVITPADVVASVAERTVEVDEVDHGITLWKFSTK